MLLRPAKIFSPLHQLRHFLEAKVTELVQQQQPTVSSAVHNAKARFYHASTTQQAISTATAQFHPKAPALYHVAEQQQQRLLKVLQQQFPIVKVFSAPTIAKPYAFQLSFANPQQFRTIVSSTTTTTSSSSSVSFLTGQTDGFFAAANGFYNSGGGLFPRTVVGYARTPFAARQFSTAKSPCVTLFQQTANSSCANTTGAGGFSHISSRFFSPAGSKMSSPFSNGNEAHARPSPLSTANNDDENKDPASCKPNNLFSRQQQCKGMSDLIQEEEEEGQAYPNKRHQPGLVRRGSVAAAAGNDGRRRTASRNARNNSNKNKMTGGPQYDYIIRHDDLSFRYTPQHCKGGTTASTTSGRHHHHWHSSRVKAPPDKTVQPTVVCLSFQLDGAPLWHSSELRTCSSSQLLDISLIQSVHSIAETYQMYLAQVVMLLNQIQRYGKNFRAVLLNGNELCVFFPSSEHWPEQDRTALARQWLAQVGIDPNSAHVVLKEMPLPEEDRQQSLHGLTTVGNNTSKEAPLMDNVQDAEILGPEYFKGIQAFLDHVDDLIETGPAFVRHH
ncbi:hypothetical protein BDB00DRAFT_868415 [Zychaea mexicana]|uniref:uncharacterized protein n=1 Tax=Zychaea mexicana TaxID=64656 RepID=UPI0022FE6834|nr:uncharacterized protein BDB00DRAFT_868415 [Zychaea mexicana]KAI9497373.1 hypothetical protein BDB00DRAFT_868415 [Zychaea mexicana]